MLLEDLNSVIGSKKLNDLAPRIKQEVIIALNSI